MAMMTQAKREFEVSTSLGKDVLLFNRMTATEGLSSLFEIELALLSANKTIDAKKILGTPVGVRVELPPPASGNRYLHGLCTDFTYTGSFGELHGYRAVLRPWLWVLTRTADCRIFQKMTTPEIIKKIFSDHGFSGEAFIKDSLSRSYKPWEYCVQYRETAFNFVSRLMEHEGIYYYFDHTANNHPLVLVDSSSAHSKFSGYAEVPYYPPTDSGRRKRDHISDWSMAWEIQSGKFAHTDYEFKKPALSLMAKQQGPAGHGHDKEEIYDYPGIYYDEELGTSLAKIRMEEIKSRYQVAHGRGNAHGLLTGSIFKLANYTERSDQEGEYLITSTSIEAASNEYTAGGGDEHEFSCSFTAIPSKEQFRPPRVTPKPVVKGPQTAVVVGPAGEEIHTDEFGRIMVQFPWDRLGKKDENSSCFMRVGQSWAHGGWGSMFIPRIGMEVIVEFLEGDPDRPIVTGCVYNGTNKPPYALPGNKTQSTIKSNSSKGGGGSNELRFEDKKGSEEIYIHAQKDRNLVIEHDETKTVHHDRTKTIDNDETSHIKHDRTETVDNNETITIHGARGETVDKDETITIHGQRTETVDKNETITISGARTETVQKDETITINGARTEQVAKDETITISGGRTETVAKDETITINGGRTESVSKDESVSISGARTLSITKDDSISVGKTLSLTVSDEITITCGSASINMKKNGDITISGKAINIKGSGDVTVKGQKILQN
ncbi:MAG TPA: type VI secretion system tip protein TssI/VgrG [Stellaceae bacterium]